MKILTTFLMLAIPITVSLALTSFAQAQAAEYVESKPNIVFVLADDQGWSDVGFNGAKFYQTPNIDTLAKNGMQFTDAYTAGPNCAPTRASIISGMYTPRHLIYTSGGRSKGDPSLMKVNSVLTDQQLKQFGLKTSGKRPFETRLTLPSSTISIADVLNEAGYTTGHFGKWHVGSQDTQGFDEFDESFPLTPMSKYGDIDSTDRITTSSIEFIKKNKDKNFFLYVSYYDVHTPIKAKKQQVNKYKEKHKTWQEDERKYNTTYAAMVEEVDIGVGRLLDSLDKLGLTENTLIIYTSDNGGLNNFTYNEPLRGGKGALYEGGVRVPFVAQWQKVIKAGTTSNTPIISVDLLPTFAELAGVKLSKIGLPSKQQPVDGLSFMSVLTDDAKAASELLERPIFWHYPLYLSGFGRSNYVPNEGGTIGQGKGWRAKPASAIRWGKWKLYEYFEDDHLELYNLEQDISETFELSTKNLEVTKKLHQRLQQWRKDTNAVVPAKGTPAFVALSEKEQQANSKKIKAIEINNCHDSQTFLFTQ